MSVFDKLEGFFRTIVEQEDRRESSTADPDLADAWEELDEYMSFGEGRSTYGPYRDTTGGGTRGAYSTRDRPARVPEHLREHFRNLELELGASLEEVQAAYKRLIRRYHPDRFGRSPKKQKTATEIIKRVNYSYHQIVAFYRSNKAG